MAESVESQADQWSKYMGWEQIGILALAAAAVIIFVVSRKGGG